MSTYKNEIRWARRKARDEFRKAALRGRYGRLPIPLAGGRGPDGKPFKDSAAGEPAAGLQPPAKIPPGAVRAPGQEDAGRTSKPQDSAAGDPTREATAGNPLGVIGASEGDAGRTPKNP